MRHLFQSAAVFALVVASVAVVCPAAALTDLNGFIHATYRGQSGGGQDTVSASAPFVPLSSVTDVSLRTGFDYKKLEAAIFVQNLTDETVRLLTLQAAGVTNAVRYNQPRTAGVNLIYRW